MTTAAVARPTARLKTHREVTREAEAARRQAEKREAEERARFRRAMASISFAVSNPTPEVEEFMRVSRQKMKLRRLWAQVASARARGSAKTLVPVDLLEDLLTRASVS